MEEIFTTDELGMIIEEHPDITIIPSFPEESKYIQDLRTAAQRGMVGVTMINLYLKYRNNHGLTEVQAWNRLREIWVESQVSERKMPHFSDLKLEQQASAQYR